MKTYQLDAGISCPTGAPLSLPTEFRGPRVLEMSAVMGKTRPFPVDSTKEGKLNSWSHRGEPLRSLVRIHPSL